MSLDWWFRNRRTGAITIAQFPNAPILVAIAGFVLRAVFDPQGAAGTVLTVMVVGGLVVWAGWEVVDGVNPWRRLLGAAVLGWQAVGVIVG